MRSIFLHRLRRMIRYSSNDTDGIERPRCTGYLFASLSFVIPGRAQREPGIHNHDREYGFRACAKRRIPE